MRFLAELASSIPALIAGVTVGRVVASLDAPSPYPLLAAIAVALAAVYVLDSLISTLLAHRAARRG
jgi:xanthosine utilization system XapX-like protein